MPNVFGGDGDHSLSWFHVARRIRRVMFPVQMVALVPPDMGVPRRLIPVPHRQGFPPVMIAQNRQPVPHHFREGLGLPIICIQTQCLQHHDFGFLGLERIAQEFLRLVQPLVVGAAYIGGDPMVLPDFHGDNAAVGLAAAQKQHIDGILRLSQDAVGLGIVHSRRFGVVLWLHNKACRSNQHRQNQKKCRR